MSETIRYPLQLTTAAHPELYEHKLDGHVVVPGAFYLAVMLHHELDRHAADPDLLAFDAIEFKSLLRLDGVPRALQYVRSAAGRSADVAFFSADDAHARWTQHIAGRVVDARGTNGARRFEFDPAITTRAAAMRETAAEVSGVYETMYGLGYTLGPSFTWLGRVWADGHAGFAELAPPPDCQHPERYPLHPGLLDSCFQLAGLVAKRGQGSSDFDGHIYIPFSIGSVRAPTSGLTGGVRYCYVEKSDAAVRGDRHLEATIYLLDDELRPRAAIREFVAMRAPKAAFASRAETLVYRHEWFDEPLAACASLKSGRGNEDVMAAREIVVLHDGSDTGRAWLAAWQAQHHAPLRVVAVPVPGGGAASIADVVHRCIDAPGAAPRLVVNLLFVGAPRHGQDDDTSLARLQPIHDFYRAWAAFGSRVGGHSRVVLLTVLRSGVNGDPLVDACCRTLSSTLGSECPGVRTTCVSVGDAVPDWPLLRRELADEAVQSFVAIAAGTRRVRRLVPVVSASRAPGGAWRGVGEHWVLVGGTGGIGRHLAHWLAQRGVRALTLIARAATLSPDSQAWIGPLRARGIDVGYRRADVTRQAEYEAALAAAETALGTIAGLFFLPAAVHDGTLAASSWPAFRDAVETKTIGALNTARVLGSRPSTLVVYASSIAAAITPPGQGAYATANALMEAVAASHRARGGRVAVMQFGPWRDTGLMTCLSDAHQRRMSACGVPPVESDAMLAALDDALSMGVSDALIARLEWAQIADSRRRIGFPLLHPYGDEASDFSDARAEVASADRRAATPGAGEVGRQLRMQPASARLETLQRYLADQVSRVLRMPDSQSVPFEAGLFELGFDSLTAMELKKLVETDLGLSLAVSTIFNHSSVEQFARHLRDEHFAEAPGTTLSLDELDTDGLAALLSRKLAGTPAPR
jgi:NAD(P)-dependent dehydrogenase (short-subunit alcohol dehydrogenase family)